MRTFSASIGLKAVVAVILLAAQTASAQTPTLRVLASNGVKAVLEELQPKIESSIGHRLAIQFGTSAGLRQQIEKGEVFDVAVMTSEAVDDLIKSGKVAAATRAVIGRSGIGVGIRAGASKPNISTPEAMKKALLNARSITYAQDGASRPHIVKMIESLGLTNDMKSKTILEQGSVRAAAKVTSGEAELLITLISEILPVPGMELVGALPPQFQSHVSFAAGVGTVAKNADAAKAMITALSGPGVTTTLKNKGIDR